MTTKKPEPCEVLEFDAGPIAVEERLPSALFERVTAETAVQEPSAILLMRGSDDAFDLAVPGTLTYRNRALTGSGRFKMLVHGMTMWVDNSVPDAVVSYLHNAIKAELTVQCNDDFAVVYNFQSGDLGIHVPCDPSARRRRALIDRGEAKETFGPLGSQARGRRRGKTTSGGS